ncbi:MAG: DUF2357 domain-containing protein [Phascolarctobacterium sp.]|nr:DUF2357 domain-containing protein [Phascolarctobacterium sp.]
MVKAISYKVNDNCIVLLYPYGVKSDDRIELDEASKLGTGFVEYFFNKPAGKKDLGEIIVEKGLDEEYVLRLKETKKYKLKIIEGDFSTDNIRIQNQDNKLVNFDRDTDTISFQFINYLGRSKFIFSDGTSEKKLEFEVVPDKIDYKEDYIKLTESIAEICSELLLEYTGATSGVFVPEPNSNDNLLEQFIFLRQFCYEQSLLAYFESIKRNPDSILIKEDIYKPIGTGMPSKKFFTNPFASSRVWTKIVTSSSTNDGYLPQEIAVTLKRDSLDTSANRFLKFALYKFYDICDNLIREIEGDGGKNTVECLREAKVIRDTIDNILDDDFFEDIGNFDIMPQNNQVLQKREGYLQIFEAFSMVELALQLNWKGKEDIYTGESKNVALLYEYWLFFELSKIVKDMEGCKVIEEKSPESFIQPDGKLKINLTEGNKSCQRFEIEKLGLKVNLYYNRTFSRKDFASTDYEGSYSRSFRPDYTLAIFPASYKDEEEAIKNGSVSFVHFDAKYRITDLTSLIGNKEDKASDSKAELDEEKISSITNTYKRGDLLKMHTYNDAIRRTIGSYVLYPGSDTKGNGVETQHKLYDEILPGVGAFAIKPSNEHAGAKTLEDFINRILINKSYHHTRLGRMEYYKELVIREPSSAEAVVGGNKRADVLKQEKCIIGYIREEYYKLLNAQGLLAADKEFLFYFYAIKGTQVYSHHKDIFTTKYFRFYTNDVDADGTYKLEPILCEVVGSELVAKESLNEKLKVQKTFDEKPRTADFYYVVKVRVDKIGDACKEISLPKSPVDIQNGNDTFSPRSPKIINI